MEWTYTSLGLSLLVLSITLLFFRRGKTKTTTHLPPGPPAWPIFGNMFDLGSAPHITLAGYRQKYGPIIWLRLGAINTMVIQSTDAATEFFKNHDFDFADRMVIEIMRVQDYHTGSVAIAPYGTYWRVLRRLTTIEMIAVKRINETESVRRKCVDTMIKWIEDEAGGPRGIHVARYVFLTSFNLLGNLMLSRDLWDPKAKEGMEFFDAMMGLMEWGGHPNCADFFPWLRWLDPQGLRRRMDRDMKKAMGIASGFVKERVDERVGGRGDRRKDFLDVLLDFEGDGKEELEKISEKDIIIFILEIFIAGSETTSSTIEWALTELLRHLDVMRKVKAELDHVIGPSRKVKESDIDNLPYLQAVIKETLRLHPPIPFLVPRRATKDTKFMEYDIPENTQIFINAWAIGRDPDVWTDPLYFKPERFLESNIDYRGQHYQLIPFGAGRRMCAGVPLAHRVLNLVLGSLLHHFDWELEKNVTPDMIDMKDRLGVVMRKFVPLHAIPKKR